MAKLPRFSLVTIRLQPDFTRHKDHPGLEQNLGTPSFTPAMVAAIQVSEAVKVLLNKGEPLRHQLLYIDVAGLNLWQIIDC